MMPKAGSLGSLARESFDVSDLEVLDDMLLIQVECIGLNFADIFACQGLYSATPQGGFVPGLEFSGTVLKVGKSVTAHREGDRVMGVTRFGAFTTHLVCKAAFLRPLPAGWGFEEGAAFLCTALTAWYGLVKLGALAKDHTVLVHSAAGGVGLASSNVEGSEPLVEGHGLAEGLHQFRGAFGKSSAPSRLFVSSHRRTNCFRRGRSRNVIQRGLRPRGRFRRGSSSRRLRRSRG